jgi:hypothetical protein
MRSLTALMALTLVLASTLVSFTVKDVGAAGSAGACRV